MFFLFLARDLSLSKLMMINLKLSVGYLAHGYLIKLLFFIVYILNFINYPFFRCKNNYN